MTIRTSISNAHEVLGIAEGQVSVKLGGKMRLPPGVAQKVKALFAVG
jgi:uncharacterized protein YjlB